MRRWKPDQVALAAILLLTVVLGTRGITDEASGMLGGDMARYVMNGVFLHDLIGAGGVSSFDDLVDYAERFYARYPALSLGHHPPLPFVAVVPFFLVFGVSLFAARLCALSFFVLAAWGLHALGTRLLGWQAGTWAALLFVTNLFVLRAGQYLLSEMPMVALVLVSLNVLLHYCDTGQRRHFLWFVIAAAASLYAKQLAVFMLPVYGVILVTRLGWRSLLRPHVLAMTGLGVVLALPIVAMSIALAPANVRIATWSAGELIDGTSNLRVLRIVTRAIGTHLSWPAGLAVVVGGIALASRRHWTMLTIGLVWIGAVIGGTVVFAGSVESARYSFGAMPAYCLLAAGLATVLSPGSIRWAAVAILGGAVLWQTWLIRDVRPSGAGGYEAAAKYVTEHSREAAVLFDGAIDTGYFVFFVRKHDPAGRILVLRSDKVMATPPPAGSTRGGWVTGQAEVDAFLHRFGVHLIVIEERTRGPLALRQFQEALKSDRFIERQRIPIVTTDPLLKGRNLVVYEFRDARPPDPEAELDINLPKGGREIKLRMKDLLSSTGR